MGIFENDPLLGNRTSLEQLERQNEMYAQKLQELQKMPIQATQRRSLTPIWDEIDKIVSSLNEQEKSVLINNKEYYENSMSIQEMINAEILMLVKGRIESSPDGKAILEQQLSFVRRMAKSAKDETAKRDALFREYMTQYSDMSWKEFIDMKNGKTKTNK